MDDGGGSGEGGFSPRNNRLVARLGPDRGDTAAEDNRSPGSIEDAIYGARAVGGRPRAAVSRRRAVSRMHKRARARAPLSAAMCRQLIPPIPSRRTSTEVSLSARHTSISK